jgi:hypothetical protein
MQAMKELEFGGFINGRRGTCPPKEERGGWDLSAYLDLFGFPSFVSSREAFPSSHEDGNRAPSRRRRPEVQMCRRHYSKVWAAEAGSERKFDNAIKITL